MLTKDSYLNGNDWCIWARLSMNRKYTFKLDASSQRHKETFLSFTKGYLTSKSPEKYWSINPAVELAELPCNNTRQSSK